MNESFIGTPSMNGKIKLFSYSFQEIKDFNLLILMQIDNALLSKKDPSLPVIYRIGKKKAYSECSEIACNPKLALISF